MAPQATSTNTTREGAPGLIRGLGLGGAIAVNVNLMIGVGPFITMPLVVEAMGGPQAILGWVAGALLAICDGLVVAELGAAMPDAGGSYAYIRDIYGPRRWGRLLSFLYVWQLSFSAPLSLASGAIGFALYAAYLWPGLLRTLAGGGASGWPNVEGVTLLAMGVCLSAMLLAYRRIDFIDRAAKLLFWGVLGTMAWVIVAGFGHFQPQLAFDFPPGAFRLSRSFFSGLGAAMLVTTYDYWGYYNICFLGAEVRDPGRTIPRAVIYSILLVASLYLAMTLGVLGVVPWRELLSTAHSDARRFVIAAFMERLYGRGVGSLITLLILWTAFASVFSLLLGYSRVPYAAAMDGNYFRAFARLHARHRFPTVSVLTLGLVGVLFCLLTLQQAITALVVIRLLLQFLVQAVGVLVLRWRRPDLPRPFRMWLYPAPALAAIAGFVYILIARPHFMRELRYAGLILIAGVVIFLVRAWRRSEWPFERQPRAAGSVD